MPVDNKKVTIIVLILLLVVGGVGFWYWTNSNKEDDVPEPESLGEKIFEKAQNPIKDELPQSNPFEAKANPFETETNPFQGVYKNPFE